MPRRWGSVLLVMPAAVLYCSLFVAAAFYFFMLSFWSVRSFRVVPGFTLANYVKTFTTYWESACTTLALAFTIALAATVIGFFYAWLIRFRAGPLAPLMLFVALITLFGGYLMKIYAWKTMLGESGAINSALMSLGLISKPIDALLYSPTAVIITLTHFMLPFAILPAASALRGIGDAEIESARDLGATPFVILRDIVVPRARPGIVAGFSRCYLIAAGDYLTPQLVGGKMAMFGHLIAPQFGTFFNWPLGAAMSFTILGLSLIMLTILYALFSRIGRMQ